MAKENIKARFSMFMGSILHTDRAFGIRRVHMNRLWGLSPWMTVEKPTIRNSQNNDRRDTLIALNN